ncbi:tRNA threonylcarbamoyladenosine dehydratase [Desulforhopalus vacuolatus]|uniref:tRNA threonylcarbamoyladenosine dehydratase n=1 Tax=Desulforhopalus vacuolatus TaxID=40414 RepID=UPI0019665561|nr:tRNA threonylcarbamoyladenosine dehydratase [Desulforhopalus vacuolatus]MBM9519273.1 tRNA threonylcarbamoyladenosine dehydratase [Desulforhopalus vacuolatus]
MTETNTDRFARTRLLLGKEAFSRLCGSRVTVVGIGAVGSYTVEALARAGVGSLRLVDFDCITASNINRQLLALESTLGATKVSTAAARIAEINPACEVQADELFCRNETLERILTPPPDLLIDAIDSLNPKTDLLEAASRRQIPVISSMGAALRTDPGAIRNGDLFSSTGCPLARNVRRRLRRRGIDSGIASVYSIEPSAGGIGGQEEFTEKGRGRNILGSLSTIPGIFGLTIANMALLHLAGIKKLSIEKG